ncbi:MAG: hypothetical protein IPG45_15125 [Deltaproteobacteria bacterium]|jgi:hypothetical protein|nr:hypothetical protein [Deltaproteobacteria bacterium]
MMKLMEELIDRAGQADRQMYELGSQELAQDARRRGLQQLGAELDRLAADGWLESEELEQLREQAEALGVSLSLPTGRTEVTPRELEELRVQIDLAKAGAKTPGFEFEAQRLLGEYSQAFDLASRVSKAEHEIYLVAIKNLVA